MKRLFVVSVLCCFMLFASSYVHAETYAIGADVAVKVDYFHFTDGLIGDLNAQNGIFVGVEAYKQLCFPNFYLGLEVGWAGTSGSVSGAIPAFLGGGILSLDSNINYIPIELNAKYVIPFSPCFFGVVGGGGSISHFGYSGEVTAVVPGFVGTASADDGDWVWGGQFFGELNYKYGCWFAGINVKYQLTQEIHLFGVDTGANANNLRVGGQVGFMF